jgi:hypothetical protein
MDLIHFIQTQWSTLFEVELTQKIIKGMDRKSNQMETSHAIGEGAQ